MASTASDPQTNASTKPEPHDAPHPKNETKKPRPGEADSPHGETGKPSRPDLDAVAMDPYDNVACTD
jgi:hypothetical protein